jgi:hypothetical protein
MSYSSHTTIFQVIINRFLFIIETDFFFCEIGMKSVNEIQVDFNRGSVEHVD